MKTLTRVVAVVIFGLAVSVPMLVPGDGAAVPRRQPPFPPFGANTVLITSPLIVRSDLESLHNMECNVVNVTSKTIVVTIAGFSSNGIIKVSDDRTVPPQQAENLFFIPDAGFGYCAFALSGNADSVRAVAQAFTHDNADNRILQGVSEAR